MSGLSLRQMIAFGFAICVLVFIGLGTYSLRTLAYLNHVVDAFITSTATTAAMNADIEDVFEARIAALTFKTNGDTASHDEVLSNLDEVLTASPLTPFLGQDADLDEASAAIRKELEAYRRDYTILMSAQSRMDALFAEVETRGPAARQALSRLREAAKQDGSFEEATQVGLVQERVLLARYYLVTFLQNAELPRYETAVTHVAGALDALEALRAVQTNATRRTQADEVKGELLAMSDLLPVIRDIRLQVDDVIVNRLTPVGVFVQNAAEVIVDQLAAEREAAGAEMAKSFLQIRALMPFIIGGLTLFSALIAVLITRRMTARFKDLVTSTEALARGKTDISIHSDEHDHEFGRLSRALKVFQKAEAERQSQAAREAQTKAETDSVVQFLNSGLSALAQGDLTARIDDEVAAEFGDLVNNFNTSATQLEEIMRSVLATSDAIASGSSSLTSAASNLANRTEQQATALTETTATVAQIKEAVEATAANSDTANTLVDTARERAARGSEVVTETVDAMSRIEQSSNEISRIIGVIDDIAFQTNLLALNAGVEAARAGSAGQGFAVVAAEVRALAQRAGDAAQEIKKLIVSSREQVKDGTRLTTQANKPLAEIAEVVRSVSGAVSDINSAAQSQATGIREINQAMTELDNLTQQNAAMVEETTAASIELTTDVEEMRSSAAIFKLSGAGKTSALAS